MPHDPNAETLVVAVSSRALFDLEDEARLFAEHGMAAFAARQQSLETVPLSPGPAFPLVRGLLALNAFTPPGAPPFTDAVVVSSQHPDTGLRVLNSIGHHGLAVSAAAFTGGGPTARYLQAFRTGLLLSRSGEDAQAAADMGIAAAAMYDLPENWQEMEDGCLRVAFDGDAVVFSDESEAIFQRGGIAAFVANEEAKEYVPLPEGPHGRFLRALHRIRAAAPQAVRIALVTARGPAASGSRALRTLRAWGIGVDEAIFLNSRPKAEFVRGFRAHLFFDDKDHHLRAAAEHVPSGRVPCRLEMPAAA